MKNKFIDAHSHIHTIDNKLSNRVKDIILLNNFEWHDKALFDNDEYNEDYIYKSIGIHPNEVNTLINTYGNSIIAVDHIQKELIGYIEKDSKKNESNFVALGESGIDLFRSPNNLIEQMDFLYMHALLAKQYNKSLIIHARACDANHIINAIKDLINYNIKIQIHSFSLTLKDAKELLNLNCYLSFSGMITFKNTHLIEIVEYTPLNNILCETDCPFLTPVPHRGKENKPEYVSFVYNKISEIKNIPINNLQDIVFNNFFHFINRKTNFM